MRALVIAAVLGLLAACSPPKPPLRIGLPAWPPNEIARLAGELGYFDDSEIVIVEFSSPAEASRAYEVGGLDAVALTMDYVLQMNAQDPDHKAFIVIDESLGADSVLGHRPVATLADIAGMRIGLESGPLGAHMLQALLAAAQLEIDDVTPVFIDIPDQHDAFVDGRVDLVVTYEPLRSELLEQGAVEIFDSSALPGEIVDVFMTRESRLLERHDDYRRFTRAWFHALEKFQSDPLGCAALIAGRFDMTAEEYLEALRGVRLVSREDNLAMLGANNDWFLDRVSRFLESMREIGIDPDVQLENLFIDGTLAIVSDDDGNTVMAEGG